MYSFPWLCLALLNYLCSGKDVDTGGSEMLFLVGQ